MSRWWILLVSLVLCSCSQQEMLEKFSSPADQAEAKHYIDALRARNFGEIEQAADASIRNDSLPATLEKMANLIPAGDPTSSKLVGAQLYKVNDVTTVNTTFEYQFPDKWLLINVAVKTAGSAKTITGFNVKTEAQSLEATNRFTLGGKPLLSYLVVAWAIASALLTLYALVMCIRTRLARRKWLWILFILFGVCELSLNWTTGAWTLSPLMLLLFSAGFLATPYGPWMIEIAFPLGAIWFLLRRRKLAEKALAETVDARN